MCLQRHAAPVHAPYCALRTAALLFCWAVLLVGLQGLAFVRNVCTPELPCVPVRPQSDPLQTLCRPLGRVTVCICVICIICITVSTILVQHCTVVCAHTSARLLPPRWHGAWEH